MNIKLLKKLYQHTAKSSNLLHEHFDIMGWNEVEIGERFRTVNNINYCGTSGCLAGELPAITPRATYNKHGELLIDGHSCSDISLANLFDISTNASFHLFFPNSQSRCLYGGKTLTRYSTLEDARGNLKSFIKWAESCKINEKYTVSKSVIRSATNE